MLKRFLHIILGYKIEVDIPHIGFSRRTKVVRRCYLSSDCTVRFLFHHEIECYLEPGGVVRGLPTEWKATWRAI